MFRPMHADEINELLRCSRRGIELQEKILEALVDLGSKSDKGAVYSEPGASFGVHPIPQTTPHADLESKSPNKRRR